MPSSPMSNKSSCRPSSQATSSCWTISAPTRSRGYVKPSKPQAQSCFTCLPIRRTSIRSSSSSQGAQFDQWYAESIVFGSGRPILIVPHARKRAGAFALGTVVVAWDFSRPATRAVADALPILEKAKHVFVVTVTNEKIIDTKRSGAELAKHLAHHGIDVVLDTVDAAGRGIGDVLESYVTSRNADILVMGAYGHSRIREFILGGATRSMLSRPPLSVFFSH